MLRLYASGRVLACAVALTDASLSLLKSCKVKGIRFPPLKAICGYLDCQPGDILEFQPDEVQERAARPY